MIVRSSAFVNVPSEKFLSYHRNACLINAFGSYTPNIESSLLSERARNLCYMIVRREKLKRSRFRAHESVVKAVCRRVKKQARLLSDEELIELSDLPFIPDDIYDCGPTFARRSLSYARALPDQELLTRQELSRLEEQSSKPRRAFFHSSIDSEDLKLLPLTPVAAPRTGKGRGRPPNEASNPGFVKPRLKPGRPPGSLNKKKRPASPLLEPSHVVRLAASSGCLC